PSPPSEVSPPLPALPPLAAGLPPAATGAERPSVTTSPSSHPAAPSAARLNQTTLSQTARAVTGSGRSASRAHDARSLDAPPGIAFSNRWPAQRAPWHRGRPPPAPWLLDQARRAGSACDSRR